MRAEILKALEKKLRGAQLDQPELLAVTRELQDVLGYAKHVESWEWRENMTKGDPINCTRRPRDLQEMGR